MSNIWFTSDTHYWHSNILRFTGSDGKRIRPEFGSVEQMNETMIERWNERVKDGDHVYHLGDVTFRYDGSFNNIMSRLRGRKRLIVGNHDHIKNATLLQHFEKVMLWRGFREFNFTCVHIPLMLNSLRDGNFCVHGHIHQNVMEDPHYINICVERTNYYPLHVDEILEKIKVVGE